jgi:hypothetical protein
LLCGLELRSFIWEQQVISAYKIEEKFPREEQWQQLMLQEMFQNAPMQVCKSVCQPSTPGTHISAAVSSSLDIHDGTFLDVAL